MWYKLKLKNVDYRFTFRYFVKNINDFISERKRLHVCEQQVSSCAEKNTVLKLSTSLVLDSRYKQYSLTKNNSNNREHRHQRIQV